MLVGDAIIAARRLIPDLPQTYPPPENLQAVAVSASPGTIIPGTYFMVATFIYPWGETTPCAETSAALGVGQIFQVSPVGAIPAGVMKMRVYMTGNTGVAGGEIYFVDILPPFPGIIFDLPNRTANPPVNNSAFNPDTDGSLMSAAQMFFWFNEGLTQFSRIIGGIRDYAGVGSSSGQPMYIMPETWRKIDNLWYDGYPMGGGKKGDFYKRNAITSGVLAAGTVSVLDDRTIIEIYPQPARTANTTVTTAPIGATDTVCPVANTGAFLTPFGFAQIGTEIVQYAPIVGSTLSGLIRRLGGTSAASWPTGTQVNELNIVAAGRRVVTTNYQSGDSIVPLPLPQGWSDIMTDYLLSKAREAEQDDKNATRLTKQFEGKCEKIGRQLNVMTGQAQMGPSPTLETYYNISDGGGGVIIP